MPRGIHNNLIPANERSYSEATRNGRKGGQRSGEVRREKKRLRDCAELLLSLPVADTNKWNKLAELGVPPEDIDNRMLMVTGLLNQASKGDTAAAKEIRNLIGEDTYPDTEEQDARKYIGLPLEIVGKEFADPYRWILSRKYDDYDFTGGRGSLKSSSCGLIVIDQIERNPLFCGLAVRQVKDTLRDSVYEDIKAAIDRLNDFYPWFADDYKCTTSPMIIIKKSTGQKIFFRGGDDPGKIKSIKPPKDMHIGIVWVEEADQLHGAEALRNIKQSAFRGGDDGILIRSYNTPRSQQHFINKEKLENNPRRVIHHSHFKNAPPEWLGKRFYDDAEYLKATNPRAYAHEYDGEAVGNGANVFENVMVREITDADIESFDRCYYGLDFGWIHPFAFNGMSYDSNRRKLYIFEEKHGHRTSNDELEELLDPWIMCRITGDSAEPKSISHMRANGFDIRGAIKGPGTREYSFKWLASLAEIIIDPVRCPHTAEEFLTLEHERTKDGEITSEIPDVGEDHVSAVRYALEEVWKRRGQ